MKAFTAMKKILGSAALASLCLLSSCKVQEGELPKNEKEVIKLGTVQPENNPVLPFEADFTGDDWKNYIFTYFVHTYENWYTEETGEITYDYKGNPVDEKTFVLKKEFVEQVPAGANGPSFFFGNSDFSNYSFSFDFLLGDNSGIMFSVYNQSLITDWQPEADDPESRTQPFWFELGSKGLTFETAFGKGSFFYEDEDGKVLLKEFDADLWNTIELKTAENSLHLIFNGEDIGEIYEFDGTQCGSAGLRGGNGCMFKNIKLTPAAQG